MKRYEILVPPGKVPERLDVFLTNHIENATRTKVQQAIKEGFVKVNGAQPKASHKVAPGEVIHVEVPGQTPPDVVAENIPLDIMYEDDQLLVVNKPAGMVVHPAYANYTGTLVNALLFHYSNNLSSVNDPSRPGIVHRLDKDTSGLMIVAKNDTAHARLAKQFSNKTLYREYWAIVWGTFAQKRSARGKEEKSAGTIEAALGRSKSDRKKIAVTDDGKQAITEYNVLEEYEYLSLIQCKLKTGRTHQIRVHMNHIGHPVFGDPTYGGRSISWGGITPAKKKEVEYLLELLPRQALHAKTLSFIHPATKAEMRFESNLPADMEQAIALLRKETTPL